MVQASGFDKVKLVLNVQKSINRMQTMVSVKKSMNSQNKPPMTVEEYQRLRGKVLAKRDPREKAAIDALDIPMTRNKSKSMASKVQERGTTRREDLYNTD